MPGPLLGFQGILGVGKETTWGTAVAATQKVAMLSESINQQFEHIINPALMGSAARSLAIKGPRRTSGTIQALFTYTLADRLWEQFFGTFVNEASGEDHYNMDSFSTGKSLTVALQKQVSVWEFAGWKGNTLTLTGTPGEGMRFSIDGFAKAVDLASAVNTTNVLAALTDPLDMVLFSEVTLLVNDNLTEALDSGDEVDLSQFQLTMNRNMEEILINDPHPLEPFENDLRDTTLSFTIPLYMSNTFINHHLNHTRLQAKLICTNGTRSKIFRFPKLLCTSAPVNITGPDLRPVEVNLTAYQDINNENTTTEMNFTEEVRLFES
jgi:hypothetical protein